MKEEDKYSVPIGMDSIVWKRRDIVNAIKSLSKEDCYLKMDVLGMMHLVRIVEEFEKKALTRANGETKA